MKKLIIVCAVIIGTSAHAYAGDHYYNSVPSYGKNQPSFLKQANEAAARDNYHTDNSPVIQYKSGIDFGNTYQPEPEPRVIIVPRGSNRDVFGNHSDPFKIK